MGKVFGTWEIVEYLGASKYIGMCNLCENLRELHGYFLKKGEIPKCNCTKVYKEAAQKSEDKAPRRLDLSNQQFDEWTVLGYAGNKKWTCRCSCGKIKDVDGASLRSGSSKSCGHALNNELIDLTGMVFDDWTVIKQTKSDSSYNTMWQCRCSCGTIRDIRGHRLRNKKTSSCGHATTGFKDLTGEHIGELKVIKRVKHEDSNRTFWECECSCGATKIASGYSLINKLTLSCGHDTIRHEDLSLMQFGEWTALHRDETLVGVHQQAYWVCRCSCGTVKTVSAKHLKNKVSRSCGCKAAEYREATFIQKYNVKNLGELAQRGRTPEQLDMTSSKEKLLKAIGEHYKDSKPTPTELGELIGVQSSRAMVIARELGIEDAIDVASRVSRYELELAGLFPCTNTSNRDALGKLELDLYYPEKQFAIEFNGSYWHSDIQKKSTYHQDKSLLAQSKGIFILHIYEYEWNDPTIKAKLIDLISSRLYENNSRVIYGRNCTVQRLDSTTSNEFLNQYHLQGGATSSIQLGLYSEAELIGVMTFGTPRFNQNYEYELIRLCWKSGVKAVGGAEKLFKHFISENSPASIISYCDIGKFSGSVYTKLGFTQNGLTPPNYRWVDIETNETIPRYQTMKQKLLDAGLGHLGNTEAEIMRALDYYRVYDSGNFQFGWKAQ